jgi:hypothetical protein
MKNKIIIMLTALVLLLSIAVIGTIAYLIDVTTSVENTFVVGDINIDLTETDAIVGTDKLTKEYKFVPGDVLVKDPTVTVKKGSEECWLFVQITETDDLNVINWEIADGWTELKNGVYYRVVGADETKDQPFAVLKNNQVTVSTSLTKTQAEGMAEPTLTFKAYAVQKDNVNTASDAWAIANS